MLVQILQDILETGNLANYTNEEAKGILGELYNITDEKILKEKYDRLKNIYIDEVRILNGVSEWESNFVPYKKEYI